MHTYALNNAYKTKNSSKRELFQIRTIKVISGNFATVDLREEPCYTEPPEKGKFGGKTKNEQQNVKWWAAIKTGLCKRVSAKPVFAALSFSLFLMSLVSRSIKKA